jgi:hypothetical protein
MYFVFIYENRRMKTVEIVLRKGEGESENNGGDKFNLDICKHICKYHDVSPLQLLYANKMV